MTRPNAWRGALAAVMMFVAATVRATDFDEAEEVSIQPNGPVVAFQQKVRADDILVIRYWDSRLEDDKAERPVLQLAVDGVALPPVVEEESVLRLPQGGTLQGRITASSPPQDRDPLPVVVHRIPAARLMPVERYRLEVGGATRVVVPDTEYVTMLVEVTGGVTTAAGETLTPMHGRSMILGSPASDRTLGPGELGVRPHTVEGDWRPRPLQQRSILPGQFTSGGTALEIALPASAETPLASGGYDVDVYRLRPVAWQQKYDEPIRHKPLCGKGEQVAFSCLREDGTTVSICGSGKGDADGDGQKLQLRFGRRGRTTWKYPSRPARTGWYQFDHDPLPTEGYGTTRFTVDAKPYQALIRRSGMWMVHYLYDTGFRVAVSGPGRKESEPLRCVESQHRWEGASRLGP